MMSKLSTQTSKRTTKSSRKVLLPPRLRSAPNLMLLWLPETKALMNGNQIQRIIAAAEKRDDNLFSNGYAVADRLPDLAAEYR